MAGSVVHSEIAGVQLLAADHAVTVDRVAVEIERDVVGTDHEPVAGTVDEIALQPSVLGDRLAALDPLRGGRSRKATQAPEAAAGA